MLNNPPPRIPGSLCLIPPPLISMAIKCTRFVSRTSISSIKSYIKAAARPSSASAPRPAAPPLPRFTFSRIPSELGCAQSLLPLHSAVAAARMTSFLSTTSRSCRALSQGT